MKKLLMAASLAVLISPAYADDYDLTVKRTGELPRFTGTPASGDLELIWDVSSNSWKTRDATTEGVTFSTAVTGNPFSRINHSTATSAAVSSGSALLAAATGKVIYPISYTLTALGGDTAGATTLTIECTGGTDIAAIPVATAKSGVPVTPSTSAPSGTSQQNFFNVLNVPCPSGQGLQLVKTGSAISGASSFELLLQYVEQ